MYTMCANITGATYILIGFVDLIVRPYNCRHPYHR